MAKSSARPPYAAMRDPRDKSDPVELLLDITFVALLNQASSLLLRDSSANGIVNALAVLLAALLFWQMTAGATGIVPVDGMMRVLNLVLTGAFLVMAASVHQAFADERGAELPWLFAAATTVAGIGSVVMWAYVGSRDRRWRGNGALLVSFAVVMIVCAWLAERVVGGHTGAWLLIGYCVSMVLISITGLPFPARFGFGSRVPGWAINGARAYRERYNTSYVVGCVLCLQLLEVVGESVWADEPLPVGALLLVGVALNMACLLYWLYEPLVEPARQLVDPRNPAMSDTRKVAHSLGDVYGHVIMFAGLVLTAGALRTILTTLVHSGSALGSPAGTPILLEFYGGIALCLTGQALFYWFTCWRPDPVRVAGAAVMVALIPLMSGRPLLVAALTVPVVVGATYLAVRRRLTRPAESRAPVHPRWRPWVRRTGHEHEVTGFELFFDFMAAFAFAQVGHIAIRNPTVPGALHALLVLGSIYGCWVTYCWAANNAHADSGTLRQLYVAALFALILLSLTMPFAFTDGRLTTRVLLFLGAYLTLRLGSAAAMLCLYGRTATRRAQVIAGFGTAAAICVAAAVCAHGGTAVFLWVLALGCEVVAIGVSAWGMTVNAPAHLAERFAFLVILGLDMSLSGVCEKFAAARIGPAHVALIGAALTVCTLMWWLYFDALTHYAEHRLHHSATHTQQRHRFAHTHYNALHLVILAGMVCVGFGLRSIAETAIHHATGSLGPALPALTAASLTLGLAAYLIGVTAMWTILKRPTVTPWLIAGTALALTPLLVGLPAIQALAVLITVTGLPLLAHALTPAIRAHRRTVHAETRAVLE